MTRSLWRKSALVAFVGIVAACGDNSDPVVSGPRRAMLESVAFDVILPGYREFVARSEELKNTASDLVTNPTAASFAATRSAWRSARRAWKRTEAFRIGPTDDLQLRIRTKVDWSPVREDRIESEIASDSELTPEHIDTLGTNRRGFHAIEYVLFDLESDESTILAGLVGEAGERRRQFVAAVAADIHNQAVRLLDAWTAEDGGFLAELLLAGRGSEEYPELKDAVDELVGSVVSLASQVEENKLGRPYGLKSNGVPRPENVESPFSRTSLADIDDNLRSLLDVYTGSDLGVGEGGLSALVVRISASVDEAIRHAIIRTRNAVRAIGLPLALAVTDESERDRVAAAVEAATELRMILQVDMVSALGATPRFVGDGD